MEIDFPKPWISMTFLVRFVPEITSTGYELTPVAIAAGRRLADRLFLGEGKPWGKAMGEMGYLA